MASNWSKSNQKAVELYQTISVRLRSLIEQNGTSNLLSFSSLTKSPQLTEKVKLGRNQTPSGLILFVNWAFNCARLTNFYCELDHARLPNPIEWFVFEWARLPNVRFDIPGTSIPSRPCYFVSLKTTTYCSATLHFLSPHTREYSDSTFIRNPKKKKTVKYLQAKHCVPWVVAGFPRHFRSKWFKQVVNYPGQDNDVVDAAEIGHHTYGIANTWELNNSH